MRILSVATTLPYPPDHATRLRTWNLLRGVAEWADLTLLTWSAALDPKDRAAVRPVAGHLVLHAPVTAPMGRTHRTRRWLRALGGDLPPWVQALRIERGGTQALADVQEAHRTEPFDVVVAEDDAAAFLLPAMDAPVVAHRHNVFSRTLKDLRRGPARLLWPLEHRIWRRLDAGTGFARLQVATTEESAAALRDILPSARVEVVPNGVDLSTEPVECGRGRDVVVIGTMDYAPNAEGVEWFVRNVWPRVRRQSPDADLLVVGRGSAERLGHLTSDGLRVLGYVPDLRQACATARAGVVPLQAGMGIKTKTLDLLAMGIPVVSTPAGAEGIGHESGIVVTSEPAAFGDAVVGLLGDAESASARGTAARRYVGQVFSWDAAAARYRALLEGVAANVGAPA